LRRAWQLNDRVGVESLITHPITLVTLAIGIVVAAYEMRTALEPVHCPECPHCLEAARRRASEERSLQEEYARRHGLDREDDDRRIG
jgi:hypothetical protein